MDEQMYERINKNLIDTQIEVLKEWMKEYNAVEKNNFLYFKHLPLSISFICAKLKYENIDHYWIAINLINKKPENIKDHLSAFLVILHQFGLTPIQDTSCPLKDFTEEEIPKTGLFVHRCFVNLLSPEGLVVDDVLNYAEEV